MTITLCQVMTWLLLLLISVSTGYGIIQGSPNPATGCSVFEEGKPVLGLQGSSSFLISLNFREYLTSKMLNQSKLDYSYFKDSAGSKCLKQIEQKANSITNNFLAKIEKLHMANQGIDSYLKNTESYLKYISKPKRGAGVTLSIVMALLSMFGTAGTLFYTHNELNLLEKRILTLEDYLLEAKLEHNVLTTNIEYLYQHEEFIGVTKTIMAEHLKNIGEIHSCDILTVSLDSILTKHDNYLNRLYFDIYRGDFTPNMISGSQIVKLMKTSPFFDETIYKASPFSLYELSDIRLIDFNHNMLTFMINFPVITLRPKAKLMYIFNAQNNFMFEDRFLNSEKRFLVPMDINTTNLNSSMKNLYSISNCVRSKRFTFCRKTMTLPPTDIGCIESLLESKKEKGFGNSSCKIRKEVDRQSDYHIQKTLYGYIIRLGQYSKVVNTASGTPLSRTITKEAKDSCGFMLDNYNFSIVTRGGEKKYVNSPMKIKANYHGENFIRIYHPIPNLILPTPNFTVLYNDSTISLSIYELLWRRIDSKDLFLYSLIFVLCVIILIGSCIGCCYCCFCKNHNNNPNGANLINLNGATRVRAEDLF